MENQVESLKLNVTNIKSYLINSNKQLRSLKIQKKNLFSKLEKQQKVRSKEQRIETKNLGIGSGFSGVISAVTTPAKGIFDKILDFLGLILIGILVQKLPLIIEKINQFFNSNFIKSIKSVFNAIVIGTEKLGELIDILTPQKQKELDEELELIGNEADNDLELMDQADRDISELDKELRKIENNNKPEPTPQVPTAPMPIAPGSTHPVSTPQPPAAKPQESQKLSKGGTVQATNNQQTKPAYVPRKSGQLKQSERGMSNGFEDFSLAVDGINETTQRDEKNVLALAELSKNFREWSSLSGDTSLRRTTPSPSLDHPVDPSDYGPSPESKPTTGSLAYVLPQGRPQFTSGYRTANRPGHRGVDIGVDRNSPVLATQDGKIVDFYPQFGDWGDAVVVKYNDGYTGIYGHVIPSSGLKIGDSVKKGQTIAKVKFWPKGVAGNTKYPDNTHLHYERKTPNGNWINPSPYLNSLSSQSKTNIKSAQITPLTGKDADPQLKGLNLELVSGKGGDRRLNTTSSNGNKSLFIYAIQPVETFVLFPQPIPMEIPSESTQKKSKVPPIWRE